MTDHIKNLTPYKGWRFIVDHRDVAHHVPSKDLLDEMCKLYYGDLKATRDEQAHDLLHIMKINILEKMCRIICKAEGVDPDAIGMGLGNLMPEGETYPLWKARIRVAEALIVEGFADV